LDEKTRKETHKLPKASETITEANFEGKFSNLESLINKSVQR
jgi:hypothetical protein